MKPFGKKFVVIPAVKIKSVTISGVVQIGDSNAVLPHIDSFAAGGPRGAASFNTQTFPRSRTRFHLANQVDVETKGDLSIVSPAPDPEQFREIRERYAACEAAFQRFEADGNRMRTESRGKSTIQYIEIAIVSSSAVLHIGDTKYVMPLVHTVSQGVFAGTVTPAAGGPVGAIGV
ncbi:hypothetical protein LSG31_11660 [Fodinisporobacter ferrooxydans]|uniref:Uncharacterized protein n=1 Tax=Fodinisporobacter ferrooxydans TaxID=2901836 RepID=A0ABY4CGN1_9BACL|nr:hypothetical protein LSG31_11660 [Alicyclobacillaceae bacterium MYW30-H2]